MSKEDPLTPPLEHPLLPPRKIEQPWLYTSRNETYLHNMMSSSTSTLPIACNPQSSLLFLAYKLRKAQLAMNGNVEKAVAGLSMDRIDRRSTNMDSSKVLGSSSSTVPKKGQVKVARPHSLWSYLIDDKTQKNSLLPHFSLSGKSFFPQPLSSNERDNVISKAISSAVSVFIDEHGRPKQEETEDDEEKKASFENVPSIVGTVYKYGCPICDYETDNKSHLRRHHASLHDLTLPYVCSVCKMEFPRIEKMRRHFLEEHPEQEYNPKLCRRSEEDEAASDDEEIKEEIKEETNEAPQIITPPQLSPSKSDSPVTKCNVKEPDRFGCPDCEYVGRDIWHLQRHLTHTHHTSKPFMCSQCSFRSNRRTAVAKHMKSHDKFQCIYCKKFNHSLSEHQQHVDVCGRLHRSEVRSSQFQCKICLTAMPNKKVLRQHAFKRHKIVLEFCYVCSFNTADMEEYKAHMIQHKVSYKIPEAISCNFCYQRFLTEIEKTVHIKREHPVNPMRCDQCSFNSKHASYMRMHQYLHKNNSCTYRGCNFRTNCNDTLEAHLIKHGQDNHRPLPINRGYFQCQVCVKLPPYRYRKSYFHHMEQHKKDVCCPLCHEVFYTLKLMKRHMIKCHNHLDIDRATSPMDEGVDQTPVLGDEDDEEEEEVVQEEEEEEDDNVIMVEDKFDEEVERAVSPIVIEPRDDDVTYTKLKRPASPLSIIQTKRQAVVVLVPLVTPKKS